MATLPPTLSIVIPCFNEEANLDPLFQELLPVLEQLQLPYEIICVNDGSRDRTLSVLLQWRDRHSAIKVLDLSRNFGKEMALTAGIEAATGLAVIPMDADLQDPPAVIPALVERWQQGADVVYATRSRRQDSWLKRWSAHAFYWVLQGLSSVPIPANTGDFRLLDRRVVEALKQLPERGRFMKGLFSWVGYRQAAVYFERPCRHHGHSKWSYWQLWNFALGAIFAFSVKPLQVWLYLGLAVSGIALLYALWLVVRTLLYGVDVPGYPSLMVAILFMGGVQLITLGILGEYIGRIYDEVKQRPLYLVRDRYGFEADNSCK